MTAITKQDAINAAASVATDVAEGRLHPADLERQAVTELTALVGVVIGPDDSLWDLQVGVARGVLAAGGITPDELAEWAAVGRRREIRETAEATEAVALTGAVEPPEAPDVLAEVSSDASGPHSAENDAASANAEPEPTELNLVATDPETVPPVDRRALASGRGLPPDNGLRPI